MSYLSVVLPTGFYNLTLNAHRYSPPALGLPSPFCVPYEVGFWFSVPPSITGGCFEGVSFPADLTLNAGPGGPQNPNTGKVTFFSTSVNIDDGSVSAFGFVSRFQVVVPNSQIFVYTNTGSLDADFDVYVYADANLTVRAPGVGAANGLQAIETLWANMATPGIYYLSIPFYRLNHTGVICPKFAFGFVLRSPADLISETSCPNPMPNEVDQVPPTSIAITSSGTYLDRPAPYFFTSQRIASLTTTTFFLNQRIFTYTIRLNITSPTRLAALIMFDMGANYFQLRVRDSRGALVSGSPPTDTPLSAGFFNIQRQLMANF